MYIYMYIYICIYIYTYRICYILYLMPQKLQASVSATMKELSVVVWVLENLNAVAQELDQTVSGSSQRWWSCFFGDIRISGNQDLSDADVPCYLCRPEIQWLPIKHPKP